MGLATRAARIAAVHAAAGWAGAAVLIASDNAYGWVEAATHGNALRAALVAAAVGATLTPVFTWRRFRWWVGPPLGVVAGLGIVFLYYALWPHSWQASRFEAWKTVSVVAGVYWTRLLPLALLTGAIAARWAQRPVRPPRWARVPEDESVPPPRPADG